MPSFAGFIFSEMNLSSSEITLPEECSSFCLTLFFCSISFAQSSISGSVKDSKNEPIPGANIKIVGETSGTVTDGDGKFILKTSKKLPLTIEVTSIGFASKKLEVTSASQKADVVLQSQDTQLDSLNCISNILRLLSNQ